MGGNVRQTPEFVRTGNAEAGIIALSVANVPQLRYRLIDDRMHSLLPQAAAVIRGSPDEALARRFLTYCISYYDHAVLQRFGFLPPPAGDAAASEPAARLLDAGAVRQAGGVGMAL